MRSPWAEPSHRFEARTTQRGCVDSAWRDFAANGEAAEARDAFAKAGGDSSPSDVASRNSYGF